MVGIDAKKSTASSTSIRSTSPMLLPRQLTASVSGLKRAPWQTSHGTFTSGRKLISMVRTPWPSQPGQRPSPVLNEKRAGRVAARLGLQRFGEQLADRVPEADVGGRAGARRLADRRLVDLEHAVDRLPALELAAAAPAPAACRARRPCACTLASSTSRASVLLPEPETPVTATRRCSGTRRRRRAGCAATRRAGAAPACAPCDRAPRLQRVRQRVGEEAAGHRVGVAPTASATLPCATSRPPRLPAPGPMSMMWSARRIVSSSCSTTTSVLPLSPSLRQRVEQDAVVARVQADRRLVEHVAHALQVAAELRRQADALRLAARQRGRGAVERQVAEAHLLEELEPAA